VSLPTDTESIDRFPIGRTGVPLPWPETVVPILADGLSYDVKRPSWITCLKVLVDGLTVQCGQSNKYLSIYLMLMISEPEDQRFAALCCFQKLIMCFSCPRCLSKWSADGFYFPCTRFTQVCLLKVKCVIKFHQHFQIHLELQGHVAISHRARRQHGGQVASVSDGAFRLAGSFWGDQLVVFKDCSNNSELVWFPSNVASFSLVIVGEVARHLNRVKHHILLTARQPNIHQFCKENRELCALRAKAFPIFGKDNGMRCPWLCTSDHGSIFPREFCWLFMHFLL
jgi:hypothetical protein